MKRGRQIVVSSALLLGSSAFATAKEIAVSISSLRYKPQTVEVNVGDTVVWTNEDDRGHTVVADGGAFASREVASGQRFQFQFRIAGEFSYHCDHHPRMRGRVVVQAK